MFFVFRYGFDQTAGMGAVRVLHGQEGESGMKLNPEFVIQQVGGSTVLVPVGAAGDRFHGIIQLNKTASFIVECLQEETTEAQMKAAMEERYEATDEEITEAIRTTLEKLQECGALV